MHHEARVGRVTDHPVDLRVHKGLAPADEPDVGAVLGTLFHDRVEYLPGHELGIPGEGSVARGAHQATEIAAAGQFRVDVRRELQLGIKLGLAVSPVASVVQMLERVHRVGISTDNTRPSVSPTGLLRL